MEIPTISDCYTLIPSHEGALSELKQPFEMIAEEYPDGFHPSDAPHDDPAVLMSAAAAVHRLYMERAARISGQMSGMEKKVSDEWVVAIGADQYPVTVKPEEEGFSVTSQGEKYRLKIDWDFGQPLMRCEINGVSMCLQIERDNITYRITHRGSLVEAKVLSPRAAELYRFMIEKEPPDMSRFLLSPMPGLLVHLSVGVGDEVKEGEELAVVEAMKMENALSAAQEGKVKAVLAEVGANLAVDQAIIEFE